MRVAFVHDYIKEYGGAERVLEGLHEMYPNAPVYTLIYCPEFLGPHKERFKDWDIRPSILQNIPWKEKLISPFRLLAPFIFPMFDFSDFDVVIVSATGAYSPNTIRIDKDPSTSLRMTKVICYYHTPPRYLYGLATAREWKKNFLMQVLGNALFSWLRKIDSASSKNVDVAIANSHNVAERIKKFYHKDAVVVYPPVFTGSSHQARGNSKKNKTNAYSLEASDYYLAGGRLARPKHIDLIVKACAKLGVPLKVFGRGFAGYENELFSLTNVIPAKAGIYTNNGDGSRVKPGMTNKKDSSVAPQNDNKKNIEFVGEVTDEEKTRLMRGAKAYIFAAEDEDFGMLPVEAMALGVPVIAYKSGGPKESIIDGKTGVFFDALSVDSIVEAIKKFETQRPPQGKINPGDCIEQAKKFSKEVFIAKIGKLVATGK